MAANDNIRYTVMRSADMQLLHPAWKPAFLLLERDLQSSYEQGIVKMWLRPFEAYRHPARQQEALKNRTSRANLYESAHQFGLAVDYVPWDNGRFHWPDSEHAIWTFLRDNARRRGLRCELNWDRAHVESPLWADWHACLQSL